MPISLSERVMFFRTLLLLSVTRALISMTKSRNGDMCREVGGRAAAGGTAVAMPGKA